MDRGPVQADQLHTVVSRVGNYYCSIGSEGQGARVIQLSRAIPIFSIHMIGWSQKQNTVLVPEENQETFL